LTTKSIHTAGDIYTDWDIAQLADTLLEVVRIEPPRIPHGESGPLLNPVLVEAAEIEPAKRSRRCAGYVRH
jgi:hypothetical protein